MKNFNFFEKLWEHSRTLKRVGLVLVMCLMAIPQMWAGSESLNSGTMHYTFNDNTDRYYNYNKSDKSHTAVALGTLTGNFTITSASFQFSDDWVNHPSNTPYLYIIYTYDNWTHKSDWQAYSYDYNWSTYYVYKDPWGYTIASNESPSGSYSLKYYWEAKWNDDIKKTINNNGSNYEFTYTVLPPNVSDFTVTPSGDIISGTGTSDDPFIISYNGSLTLTSSGGTQAHSDANSTIQFSKDNSSWGTSSSNYTKTVSSITTTDKTSVDVYARYYNSASCIGAVKTKTYYYKTSPWAVAGDMNSSAWNTNTYCFGHFGRNASGKDTSYVDIDLPANMDINFKIKNRTNDNWWTYSGNTSTKNMDYATDNKVARQFNQNNSYGNTVLKTAGAGTYRFILNTTDANKITVVFPTSYKVTYHNNGYTGGGVPTDNLYYADGATVTAKDNTDLLVQTGKVFAGWNTASDGAGTFVDPADTENNTFTISSSVKDLYPVWKDGYYLISPGGSTLNTSSSDPFITGRSASGTSVTANGVTFSSYCWSPSSATKVVGTTYNGSYYLIYDTQTNNEDIYIYATGTSLFYAIYKDGVAYNTDHSDTVSVSGGKVIKLSISHSKKSRLVLGGNSLNIGEIKVVKNGSDLAEPCTAGYQLSFPGRAATTGSSKNGSIDGITLYSSSGLTFGIGKQFLPSTSGTHYAQFTTAGAIKVQVTTTDNDAFYVCTDKSNPSTTGVETGGSATTHSVDLSVAGTYYITPKSSQVDISKIAFAAITSCTAPSALAASDATTNGITLTVTDESTQDYEFYVNTSSTPPTASSVATHSVDDSKSLTIDNLSSGTTYYAWARTKCDYFNKSSWVALTGETFTTDTPSCEATAPGSISKGSASGGTGIITLTADGSPASNNTWYWQSAVDGTATDLGSGATKDVNAAGTYYLRSYCSDNGGCWSDAVSVEVSTEDLLTTPTATFSNGAYTIGSSALDLSSLWTSDSEGSVTYTVQNANGTGATISTAAFSATTAGTATVRASQAADGYYSAIYKDATITVSNPTYSVTYKANNSTAESDVVEDAESTFGDNPSFTAPSTKAFAGWNTNADGSGTHYDVGDAVPSAITVYAEWRYKVYYIASSTSESNDVTAALASKYVVSVKETTGTSYKASDYSDYALVVLSESLNGGDAGTDNHELKVIVGLNKPILNLKSYFYGANNDSSKRWKWGAPNAGKNSKGIYVKNDTYANLTSHPIYSGLTPNGSDSIMILSTTDSDKKPIQPIGSFTSGKEGYSLALVKNNSSGNGTAIHELTAAQRSTITGQSISAKYLLISLYSKDLSHLTTDGKTLIKNAADYLITGSQWVPQYKITHSSAINGDYTIQVGVGSATDDDTMSAAGTTITLAATPEDGYKLDSWTVTGDVSSDAITVTSNQFTMPAEAVTVAATFVADSYTISFDGNGADGGTEVDDVTGIDSGNDANLPENTWEKTEHTFAGWRTNVALTYVPNGGGDPVNVAVDGIVPNEVTIKNVTSNITLTAQWHANVYNVYFFAGEDASAIDGYTTYEYGEQKAMPTNVIRTGYLFEAWYDNSEYTGDPLTQMPADATGNKYYYAKWQELSSKCLYITGDVITAYNDVADDPGYYMYNDAKYVFGSGYNTSASMLVLEAADGRSYVYLDPNIGEVKQVEVHISDIADRNVEDKGISWGFTNNEANVESVDLTDMDQITSHAFTFRPTDENKQYFVFKSLATTLSIDNICVFYEPQTYTVTYDKGAGATGTVPATATYNYNDVVTVEAGTALAKDGCTFRGWFDGTTFYVIGDKFKVTDDVELEAVWQSDSGCEGRSVGSLFKMQVATGLTNGALSNDDGDFCSLTTSNYLSTLKGGTARAYNHNEHTVITGGNAIGLTNNDSYIEFTLPSAIQVGDVIIYTGASGVELNNSASNSAQVSIAAGTTVTYVVGVDNDLVGYSKIYMYRKDKSSTVTYFEVRRPVFYMSVGTPDAYSFPLGETAITTSNGLDVLVGGSAKAGCSSAGQMQLRGSSNYDLMFYTYSGGYLKLDLDNALAQGDIISFTVGSGSNQLAITKTNTWSDAIATSAKTYTIPAESPLIGAETIYLWGKSGTSYAKTISIIRAADAVSGGGEAICHFTVSFACKTGFEALDDRLPADTEGVPDGAHIGAPEDPFAIGYAFLGWYDDAACSVGHEVDFETLTITENTTIYAKWENNVHTFTGAAGTTAWETAGNWDEAGMPISAYPYCYSQVYIKAPAEIAKDTKAHVGRVDIVNDGSSNTGKLTISSGAMLIVYDKVNRITNWSTKARLATIAEDIYIGSERDDDAYSWREEGALNGALIMGDYNHETQADSATVQFASLAYTKSTWTTEETAWGERDVNQYIGIPFAHAQVSDYKPYDRYTYTNVYLYEHDRWNNSWSPMYDDDQDMSEFTGYDLVCFSLAPDDYTSPKPIFDLKGELASTDEERRIRLREYEGYYGAEENETMLANSWTAPIDIASFEVSDFENAEATIYMFNAGTSAEYDGNMEWASNYSTYPGQYTAIPINDLKLHPYYYEGYKTIPSMQSFSIIVLDDDGNSGTRHNNSYLTMDYKRLVYDPAVEAASVTTERMHAPRRVPTMEEEPLAIMLHVHGMSGMGDRIRILEREDFSFGRDNGWETSKLLGIIEAPSLYAVTEVGDQATVAVPDVEGLGLTFQAGEYDNVYTFNFEYDENEEPLYLLDKKTGIYTRVLTENTYSFVTTDKNFNERFLLTRNYQIPEVATGLENAAVDSSLNERVQKVLINDMIYILRDGHIYDATGKMLK